MLNINYFSTLDELKDSDEVILFHDNKIFMDEKRYTWNKEVILKHIPSDSILLLVGSLENRIFALELLTDISSFLSAELRSLRSLMFSHEDNELILVGKANQIIDWYKTHRHCGTCGSVTSLSQDQRVLVCSSCHIQYFPRINPCAIVLVTRGAEILLARNARFRTGFFSCLAGFIEVGESAEETVHREIKEEVGIAVKNVRYKKSQSWPFPSQLMLGFHADYLSGEIVPEPAEIEEAAWFNIFNLPAIPSAKISVAGELIQLYKQEIDQKEHRLN